MRKIKTMVRLEPTHWDLESGVALGYDVHEMTPEDYESYIMSGGEWKYHDGIEAACKAHGVDYDEVLYDRIHNHIYYGGE